MSNDRITMALAALAPHLCTPQEPYEIRAILEDLYDGAQDDLMAALRSSQDAAAAWGVSHSRARARIAQLHQKYGIGRQFGGSWLVDQTIIDRYPPDPKYRQKEKSMRAIEIVLETGTFYVPLQSWDHGEVLLPMDDGHRVIDPATFRACWDAWVSDLVRNDQILTREDLDAQYPNIEIDYE